MSEQSAIEWTDATWNPVRGCVKVSPGCKHCYAETFAERFRGVKGHAYEQGFDLRLVPEKLTEPLTWKKPRRVFVNSMSDLFQDGVPFEFIDRAFAVMAIARRHTYQVLTKRADRMRDYMQSRAKSARYWKDAALTFGFTLEFENISLVPFPLPNVWLGVSVEDQKRADERIPSLLQTPAAVRFISAEPLLGPVTLAQFYGVTVTRDWLRGASRLDWVIVGGESGPGARACQTWWIRNIVGQCRDASIPVFVKQLGARPTFDERLEHADWLFTKITNRKGGDMSEWPEDLRVRQFPEAE